jgi:hypothetical protein
MAEVYWGLERRLQQRGFDFTYDKHLYDRLREGDGVGARNHLGGDPASQRHAARFLENHDEPRFAAAFAPERRVAAAVVTYLAPGLRFFHDGQAEGRTVHVSMHVGRRPAEADDPASLELHARLLAVLARPEVHDGEFRLLPPRPAWDGNPSHEPFVALLWTLGDRVLLAVANYRETRGQCYVTVDTPSIAGRRVRLLDQLSDASYEREGDDLRAQGLYLDMPAWGAHVFVLEPGQG